MIGVVVVSHSRELAEAAVRLASQMEAAAAVPVAIAAGTADGGLGTDALAVLDAIERLDNPDGVLVMADLGSAVLSADMALEMLDPEVAARVRVTPAPLVEGLVAALVTAGTGAPLAQVAAEAEAGLAGKRAQLGADDAFQPAAQDPAETGGLALDQPVTAIVPVTARHGLHARPAAVLVAEIRSFDAAVRLRNVTLGGLWVPGESLARVTTLGAARGHQLEVSATGPQKREALYAVVALAERGFGDADVDEAPAPAISQAAAGPRGASPGLAVGPVRHLEGAKPVIPAHEPGTPEEHRSRLTAALEAVREDLELARQQALRTGGPAEAAIFDAHLMMLADPSILTDTEKAIADGAGAARAWHGAMGKAAAAIAALGDEYLRARAVDVRGVGDQVLRKLLGVDAAQLTAPGVLVAADLDPGEAGALDPKLVRGIVLAGGSPTAHAAILARAKAIPMVTGAGRGMLTIPEGTAIALDGGSGRVVVDPDQAVLAQFKEQMEARRKARKKAAKAATKPARMADGGPVIPVRANVGAPGDAEFAAASGADGCGLVRTEFLFHDVDTPPTRAEQEAVYREIAEASRGQTVVFRTLDAGGDKPLRYQPVAPEDNPFLGVRGIRLSLGYPEVLADQLSAMIAVARDHPVGIMFPMVSEVSELRQARIMTARAAFREAGAMPAGLKIGMMVEVPSVALKAAAFAPMVDFFSVGTNDLTQYSLAADRGNPAVAALADGLDPGVLALIKALCRSARGKAVVSVCGELASDPAAVPVLLGLGVRSLSVAVPAIGEVKEAVRSVSKRQARALARQALACPDAAAVRTLLESPRTED